MKRNRNHGFDVWVIYKGDSLNIKGEISPGYPERGPSYDCGGSPAEPPQIEEYRNWALIKPR